MWNHCLQMGPFTPIFCIPFPHVEHPLSLLSEYFIRSWQVRSNNRWHKFSGSIRKFFGCMDYNLTWLYFLENDVFDGCAHAFNWALAMVSLIVKPVKWLIQEHCSCWSLKNKSGSKCPRHHSTKLHWLMIYRIPSLLYQSPF